MTLSIRAKALLDGNTAEQQIFGPGSGGGFGSGLPRRNGMPGDPYNGASRFDADVLFWNPMNQSADMEILPSKGQSDARAKDAVRNDAFIQNANNIQKDSVVGSMYMLNIKPNRSVLGLAGAEHDAWETEFQEEVESLWRLEAESNNCYLDASRSMPFTGMVRLAVGIFSVGGEVLASAEWNKKDKGRPFKTCVNFVDTDRLMTPMGTTEGPNMRRGVTRDDYGAATAFTICDQYPNDPLGGINGAQFNYTTIPRTTPWGREQMIYLKDPWRPDQTRGIASMVTALKEWKMTKGFRDVTLQNAITNATFAASIESEFPQQAFDALAGGSAGGGASAISEYAGAFLGAIDQYTGNKGTSLMLDGVRIPHLFPGTKLQLRPAGTPGGVGTAFEDALLRYLAAALGVSYEQLSKNYSNTNYSSIRAAMIETWKYMQSRKRLIADRFANSVFRLWFEERYNSGAFKTLVGKPSIYLSGMTMLDAYTECEWIGASRGQIDELKETQGAMLRLQSNMTTLEYECGRLGLDWRQVLRQKARESALMKTLGIDAVTLAADMAQASAAAQEPTDNEKSTTNTKNAASGTPNGGGK